MPTYTAPLRDMKFLLSEVIDLQKYSDLAGYAEATPDVIEAVLEEAARFTGEVLAPLNLPGDAEGCHWDNGVVRTPKGFKAAYDTYLQGGWQGLTASAEWGGQELPQVLGLAVSEMMIAANWGFAMYPGLTKGATEAIEAHASDDLKKLYLPKMISGQWSGTMNLTEPHCGTDLGLLRTKAEPQADGSYKISGTKIFISAGEHDLTENIIHLVLARIPGGPEGIKGISLFIVPKFLPNKDGSAGARNGVACARIEEKMGIHSNATCVLNYENATGWLIGEPHKGMRAMFTMMNEARLAVGLQGLGIAQVAYENAVAYARERRQGRALKGPVEPDQPADSILVHPDVRRMLMTVRAFVEGARALAFWTGLQVDLSRKSNDEKIRERAGDLLAILTPVVKAYLTDKGFESTVLAQQCYGGHGYIREWGAEQFVRDARIAQIYEGTNGVQAMDLVGRKLPADSGRAVRRFFGAINGFCEENKDNKNIAEFVAPLAATAAQLQDATLWLVQNGMSNPENAGAAAHDYLNLMALTTLAYVWAMMAKTAHEKLAGSGDDKAFYETKLATGRFFLNRILPDAATHLAKLKSGAAPVMALAADAF